MKHFDIVQLRQVSILTQVLSEATKLASPSSNQRTCYDPVVEIVALRTLISYPAESVDYSVFGSCRAVYQCAIPFAVCRPGANLAESPWSFVDFAHGMSSVQGLRHRAGVIALV